MRTAALTAEAEAEAEAAVQAWSAASASAGIGGEPLRRGAIGGGTEAAATAKAPREVANDNEDANDEDDDDDDDNNGDDDDNGDDDEDDSWMVADELARETVLLLSSLVWLWLVW